MDNQNSFQFIAEIETSDRQILAKLKGQFYLLRFLKGKGSPFSEIGVSKVSFSNALMFYKESRAAQPGPTFDRAFGDMLGGIEVSLRGD